MAKRIDKQTKPSKPLRTAVEDLLTSYGAKDWAIVVRGDLKAVLAKEADAVKDSWWLAGDGLPGKRQEDLARQELLCADLQKILFTLSAFLVKESL